MNTFVEPFAIFEESKVDVLELGIICPHELYEVDFSICSLHFDVLAKTK